MSDLSSMVQVKRLIRQHGAIGYGIYIYILELIVRRLETDSPNPDLEEAPEDIALDLSVDISKIKEIINFCVSQGLLEYDEKTKSITAKSIYRFIRASETRSPEIREQIKAYDRLQHPGQDDEIIDEL